MARRLCLAARAKIDDGNKKLRVDTPFRRKYKKEYNGTWEVSLKFLFNFESNNEADKNFFVCKGRKRRRYYNCGHLGLRQ